MRNTQSVSGESLIRQVQSEKKISSNDRVHGSVPLGVVNFAVLEFAGVILEKFRKSTVINNPE